MRLDEQAGSVLVKASVLMGGFQATREIIRDVFQHRNDVTKVMLEEINLRLEHRM